VTNGQHPLALTRTPLPGPVNWRRQGYLADYPAEMAPGHGFHWLALFAHV